MLDAIRTCFVNETAKSRATRHCTAAETVAGHSTLTHQTKGCYPESQKCFQPC